MKQTNLPGVSRANHSNLGADFEAELITVHDYYRLQKIADIRKIPHVWTFITEREYQKLRSKLPASMLASTDNNRRMQRTKSDVDFVGGAGGVFLAFDAKTVKGERFPLSNVAPHQLENLLGRIQCGAITGLMIKFSGKDRVFFVPAEYIRYRTDLLFKARAGHKRAPVDTASLSIANLEAFGISIPRKQGMYDYLETVKSHISHFREEIKNETAKIL